MKSLKIFLIISAALLLFALAAGVMVWYLYQRSLIQVEEAGGEVKDTPGLPDSSL